MISRALAQRFRSPISVTCKMSHTSRNGAAGEGVSLHDLPKSNVFTSKLPPDPNFKTPAESHAASREQLGPRMVKGALFTYVRPEQTKEPELLAVSHAAIRDIGLKEGESQTQSFKDLISGNSLLWQPDTKEGIYPWAQCYGGAHEPFATIVRVC